MFFFYQFDIHNLSIEGLDSKMADPRKEFRWENLTIIEPKLDVCMSDSIEVLSANMKSLELNATFNCDICGCGFNKKGYLKWHMEAKHAVKKVGPMCNKCYKVFANQKTLEKHMKTHLKCSTCKNEFASPEEMKLHKKEHTFCTICNKEFYFVSKLAKHVTSIHK